MARPTGGVLALVQRCIREALLWWASTGEVGLQGRAYEMSEGKKFVNEKIAKIFLVLA